MAGWVNGPVVRSGAVMSEFRYRAMNARGRLVRGQLEADGVEGVFRDLQDSGLFVLELTETTPWGERIEHLRGPTGLSMTGFVLAMLLVAVAVVGLVILLEMAGVGLAAAFGLPDWTSLLIGFALVHAVGWLAARHLDRKLRRRCEQSQVQATGLAPD